MITRRSFLKNTLFTTAFSSLYLNNFSLLNAKNLNRRIKNPMLKSGIVLAGANQSIREYKDYGLVTALKLAGLDLHDTELVILSACETGHVDIKSTDGISGLTKAFFQAGASDVIMSFWSVADKETSDLMQSFYLNSKKNGNQYANALRKSKLELIDKKMHPYYWAGFVINGL